MLPITLVLLVATTALAIPVIDVGLVPVNVNSIPADSGGAVSAAAIDRAIITDIDEADLPVYVISLNGLVKQLADNGDAQSQATAAAQAVAILSKLADGIPGDNCYSAALINAVASGNSAAVGPALSQYVDVISSGIDRIVQLDQNPAAAKYSKGPSGACAGGGREFAIDGAWDIILANANSNNAGILGEQYCAVQRLYQSNGVRSNNVAAAATAAALPQVVGIFKQTMAPMSNFIKSIGTPNVANAAASAQAAIRSAC